MVNLPFWLIQRGGDADAIDDRTIAEHGDHPAAALQRVHPRQGDEPLDEGPDLLGLHQGGLNLTVLKEALGQIAAHGPAVGRRSC